MYVKPIGVSIITNGNRLGYLQACVNTLLSNCYYRPLVVAVYNNGSTDGTEDWLKTGLPKAYGVTWRVLHNDEDEGCAAGTNQALELVRECEYVLHLESDFELLPQELTGEDKLWLRRAVDLMEDGCDFLYLRKMVDEFEMTAHWWAQWMPRVDGTDASGKHLRCPGFWWSNNPHLHRTEAMYRRGVLPLDAAADGPKGTPGWSRPELNAAKPGETWIHKWGLFVHDRPTHELKLNFRGCGPDGCKYGFLKSGSDAFCRCCDRDAGFSGMPEHEARFGIHPKKVMEFLAEMKGKP
jgi:glycosyltransferase involved in cell wall biosynthesis